MSMVSGFRQKKVSGVPPEADQVPGWTSAC